MNLLIQLCKELHIPYTRSYANRQFDEHPHKYSLWGLHKLLTEYGVESEGMRFSDREIALSTLKKPFVAQVSDDLVIVKSVTDDDVTYQWYSETICISREQFIAAWSGVALLLFPTDCSGEPHYREHRNAEMVQKAKIWIALGCMLIILGAFAMPHVLDYSLFTGLLCILNTVGLYFCYLLLLRQLNVYSTVADKFCNLLKHSTCVSVLDSSAAKFVYGISWSEIGTAYFIVNIIVTLLIPDAFVVLALLSFATVVYAMWSIWYQRFRAHAWCPLCLMVQGVFVLQAITYIAYVCIDAHPLEMKTLAKSSFWVVPFAYLAAILILHFSLSVVSMAGRARYWKNSLRNFKLREDVFYTILHRQQQFETNQVSFIRFGNPDASYRLTVLSNPYCNPCASMHARISNINLDNCCVEMFFASFNQNYDYACRSLIAVYLQKGADSAWQLYKKWYSDGRLRGKDFFDDLCIDDTADAVVEEYQRHIEWRRQTGICVTPTIIVNGYRLPMEYSVEDLKRLLYV